VQAVWALTSLRGALHDDLDFAGIHLRACGIVRARSSLQ
jgi:hypothetical protein